MQINCKTGLGVAFLFSMLLCGCKLKFEDVSKDPEYAPLLNTCYSLSTNMRIYGVNSPPFYGSEINIYIIYPMSIRIKGREIITEDVLTPGAVIEVQSVKQSINHIPGYKSIDAVVKVSPFTKAVDVPVVIDLKYLRSTNYMQSVANNPK
ncbi:hypothetical protein ACFLQL_01360 [Verrucomicrobiota bacterium]